jgi:hypothetical protein
MIPISCRETVKHIDENGIEYILKPKTGDLEIEFLELYDRRDTISISEWTKLSRDFFKKIVISIRDPKNEFASNDFIGKANGIERARVVNVWHEASELTAEEKKS